MIHKEVASSLYWASEGSNKGPVPNNGAKSAQASKVLVLAAWILRDLCRAFCPALVPPHHHG